MYIKYYLHIKNQKNYACIALINKKPPFKLSFYQEKGIINENHPDFKLKPG